MKQHRSVRKINWFVLGLIGLALLTVGAYFWVTTLMNSAQSYRSPLANTPPSPGQALGAPVTRRVVVVLIDALRYDTSTKPAVMPFLNELRSQGASATMHSQPPSFSAPGWTTVLTGAWPDINDSQLFNPPDEFSARAFTQDDIFAASQRAGLNTAVSGYAWFEGLLAPSGVDAGFYTPGEDNAADIKVVATALPWLSEDYQLVLIHLDQVDYAGHHEGGPRSPNWNAAATRADSMLSEIVAKLDLTKDTVLVISDHGQIDRGGHGGPDPITLVEPFVLAGAGVVPGNYGDVSMADIAPTLAALLGTNIPASSQGHVLTNMLALSSEQNLAIQVALKAQQSQLFTAYTKSIGSTTSVGDGARAGRLGSERVWRNVLAAFLTILPGYLLYLRKDRKLLWIMAGVVLYVLFFNLRYAVIDGLTYSLASFNQGATYLLIYTATTAAVAVVLGWLVSMFGLRAFKAGPRKAAETALGYFWFTIYLLALPILLTFAINGFTVTWTLPEWYTLFIGLLSLIQSLIVA
ncbi:MAG: alkaline phosphatase family protein, partial [Candidatus Bipolaricaulota bacterium]|nr:alkaline phosphatase family protein [Candidatus Bipolaricaulota bacterium]